jgi:hypothetical protein
MSPDQIKQMEVIKQRIIEGNNELLSLLPKLKPADQVMYADRVRQTIIQTQNVFSGTNELSNMAVGV